MRLPQKELAARIKTVKESYPYLPFDTETIAQKETLALVELESGEIHVFDTKAFTVTVDESKQLNVGAKVDGEGHLTSYMADVDTDEAFAGDTEVIADGYFHESEYRSAPYFALDIDGITLLNTKF